MKTLAKQWTVTLGQRPHQIAAQWSLWTGGGSIWVDRQLLMSWPLGTKNLRSVREFWLEGCLCRITKTASFTFDCELELSIEPACQPAQALPPPDEASRAGLDFSSTAPGACMASSHVEHERMVRASTTWSLLSVIAVCPWGPLVLIPVILCLSAPGAPTEREAWMRIRIAQAMCIGGWVLAALGAVTFVLWRCMAPS